MPDQPRATELLCRYYFSGGLRPADPLDSAEMMRLLPKEEWEKLKREPLQTYKDYKGRIEDCMESLPVSAESLRNPRPGVTAGKLMMCAEGRCEQGLNYLTYSYSGGLPVAELAEFMPSVVESYVAYADFHLLFHRSGETKHHPPHLDLTTWDYWDALRLVCFSILLGHSAQLQTIMDLLVYKNEAQDALLEHLVAPYLPGRDGSKVYTRKKPYSKTQKIFSAKPEQRPGLMAKYLEEWYAESRNEPYYDRHKSNYFPGYWSLEAAAITLILGIDHSSYCDKKFYPKDLVDYARNTCPWPTAPAPA